MNEHSSWRLLMPLGMFCFAQKVFNVIEEVYSMLLRNTCTTNSIHYQDLHMLHFLSMNYKAEALSVRNKF